MIIIYLALLLLSFYLLAKICDNYFVESLDFISKRLKLSEDVAGATFMAIGSSAPEFFTALIALSKVGSEQVGAGTIVGSAIFNVLVIVGASAVVATSYLSWRPVIRDMIFYILSILVLLFTFSDGVITLYEALLYLFFYFIYIIFLANWKKFSGSKKDKDPIEIIENEKNHSSNKNNFIDKLSHATESLFKLIFPKEPKSPAKKLSYYLKVFIISIILIAIFSWVLVEVAVLLAHEIGISEVIIALTVLAAGTSVPDLLSSLIVAKKGRGDMAVSNAIGSNIFDIFIGLGFPWFLYTIFTGKKMIVSTENLTSSIFLLFFTVVSLLFLLIFQKFKLGARSGYILLIFYAGYILYAIGSVYLPML